MHWRLEHSMEWSLVINSSKGEQMRAYEKLGEIERFGLSTDEAAFHLNRKPQTLRGWACNKDGPLEPVRVNGRLIWKVSDIKRVLGFEQQANS